MYIDEQCTSARPSRSSRWLQAFRSTRRRKQQHGGAVVEFAVCLPMIMVLILGSIEATSAIFLKQSLVAAAYEGVREAARLRGTGDSTNALARAVLAARQVKDFRIVMNPPDPATVPRGGRVSIEITAPISSNSPFIGKVIKDRVLLAKAVMTKE